MNHYVRIIGGLYRGKKLPVIDAPGLRPTPDRVRETLFNWLMHDIRDAHCLDAFAGTGALGVEAVSRAAKSVVFIENSIQAYTQLQKTLTFLPHDVAILYHKDTLDFLQQTPHIFDIVFMDPPFIEKKLLSDAILLLEKNALLRTGGLLYLETNTPVPMNATYWKLLKIKQTSQVTYALYRKLEKS